MDLFNLTPDEYAALAQSTDDPRVHLALVALRSPNPAIQTLAVSRLFEVLVLRGGEWGAV